MGDISLANSNIANIVEKVCWKCTEIFLQTTATRHIPFDNRLHHFDDIKIMTV